MPTEGATAVDGRRARRERGRLAVIDAVIDLLHEGHAPPSAALVAERAGVSPASLFRYFETLDDLQHEATQRFFDRSAAHFEIPDIGSGPLGERAERFAAARVSLYEAIAPVARLGRARAFDQPHFAATLHDVRLRLAEQVREHFDAELRGRAPSARDDLVALVSTITSFEAWDHLADLGRTPLQVRRAWRSSIEQLCS